MREKFVTASRNRLPEEAVVVLSLEDFTMS